MNSSASIESNPFTFLLATNALAKRPCVACCCYQTTLNAPTVHEQVQVHLCKHDLARKLSFLPCQSLLKNCFAVAVCDFESRVLLFEFVNDFRCFNGASFVIFKKTRRRQIRAIANWLFSDLNRGNKGQHSCDV